MGLFGRSREGSVLDVIRCDKDEYLVWKWRPSSEASGTERGTAIRDEAITTGRQNAIRYGSSLRVKDGEVAVFVYKSQNGPNQDFIEGPYDDTIKTANFPVLSNIVGAAFGGESPFQAEIYFINLAGNQRLRFGVTEFNVGDPRLPDFFAPVTVNGSFTYNVTDYRAFIKLHRLINFDPEQFSSGVRDAVAKITKGIVSRAPGEAGIPLVLLNQQIDRISDMIQAKVRPAFVEDFGVNLKRFDLAEIWIDDKSPAYDELRKVTAAQHKHTIEVQTDVNLQNLKDAQDINATNLRDSLAIQREQAARFAKLQTESQFLGAHQVDVQGAVLMAAAKNLGEMGAMNSGGGSGGGGFNPIGVMTGVAVGGAMGGQMANMVNSAAQQMPAPGQTPPPVPQISYHVLVNNQITGPFSMRQLQEMARQGQLTQDTYVWKTGMVNWEPAGNVSELNSLFDVATPPPPPPPPPPSPSSSAAG